MRKPMKQSMKAVLAILAGALLTTGGLSLVEADQNWHHGHYLDAQTGSEANGKCASACSVAGHAEHQVTNTSPGVWYCECGD